MLVSELFENEFENVPVDINNYDQVIELLRRQWKAAQNELRAKLGEFTQFMYDGSETSRKRTVQKAIIALGKRCKVLQKLMDDLYSRRLHSQLLTPDLEQRIRKHLMLEASETVHKHILWVDDTRNPPESIAAHCDIARTYKQAIDDLSRYQYTDLYLDHDLGDFSGPEGRELSGYDVLMWLVQRKHDGEYVPVNFHILTANPVGRQKFEGVINRYLRR